MKPTTLTGVRIVKLTRMNSSRNGNPRFLVLLDDGTEAPTQPDASISYGIGNPEYRDVPLTVSLNGRGFITNVEVS
jgi:hypothetical protein